MPPGAPSIAELPPLGAAETGVPEDLNYSPVAHRIGSLLQGLLTGLLDGSLHGRADDD